MPGIKAPLSEVAATGVHGYAVASNVVLALFRTGDLAPETGRAQHAGHRQGAPGLAAQAPRAFAIALRACTGTRV